MKIPEKVKRVSPENLIPLDDVIVKDRIRKEYGDLTGLMESMRTILLIHPIVLAPGNQLLAGGRRLEAAKRLGWKRIPFVSADLRDDAVTRLKAERDENTERKDMTASELAEMGRRLEELETPAAKERQVEGGKRGRLSQHSGLSSMELKPEQEQTRDVVAGALGISSASYGRIKRMTKVAQGLATGEVEPGLAARNMAEVDAGKLKIAKAYNETFGLNPDGSRKEIAPGISLDELGALNIPKPVPAPSPAPKPEKVWKPKHDADTGLYNLSIEFVSLSYVIKDIEASDLTIEKSLETVELIQKEIRAMNRKMNKLHKELTNGH